MSRTDAVSPVPEVGSARGAPAPRDGVSASPTWLTRSVGVAAIAFSVLYFASDILETVQGGFSTSRLALTYAGEAAIPIFVIGLYAVQRPHIGRLGLIGAAAYAYSYVFFAGTVVYALAARAPNYRRVTDVFGAWMVVHGLIMLIGGLAFGAAIVRARVFPSWAGACLAMGAILVAVASGLPTVGRTIAEAVPAAAFIGMGTVLLRGSRRLGH